MISQTSEYALRAIVCLAQDAQRSQTTAQIAKRTRVRAAYLSKVLQALGRAGLVQAQRGIHGGFTLTLPANQISVLTVINAVDPIQRIRTCPLGLESHGDNLCPLHRKLDDALAQIERAFAQATIADLLTSPSHPGPLCELTVAGRSAPH